MRSTSGVSTAPANSAKNAAATAPSITRWAALNKAFFHLLTSLLSEFHRQIQPNALVVAGQAGHCPPNLVVLSRI